MNIILSGQKYFGKEVYKLAIALGMNVPVICTPITDKYLRPYAINDNPNIKIIPSGMLSADQIPPNIDLGICAHSFDYVGYKCRNKTRLGWISYHPSLLPRHRGRSSIEWALRMKDNITGGTVYWLNSGVDRGDIERQDWVWLDHSKGAPQIWRDELLPLGLGLLRDSIIDISNGKISKKPQDIRFSTFEPRLDNVKDLYRPDLLQLPPPKK